MNKELDLADTGASSCWRIDLFGGLRLVRDGEPVTQLGPPRAQTLLAYLAYYHPNRCARAAVAEQLWPDAEGRSGRDSLNEAISGLRKQPIGVWVVSDANEVGLSPAHVTTDVGDFSAAVATAAAASNRSDRRAHQLRAVELYRGPLLAGFAADWIMREREVCEEEYSQALCALLADLEQSGDLDQALRYVQRGIALEPLREELHCALMRIYLAVGQPNLALRQYRRLSDLLQEELESEPCPDARDLLAQIEAQVFPETPGASSSTGVRVRSRDGHGRDLPLALGSRRRDRCLGRQSAIQWLCRLLAPRDRGASPCRLLTLTGPPGIGKSRLAVEVASRLAPRFPGGLHFVDLTGLDDARRLPECLRDALGPHAPGNSDALQQVLVLLSWNPALLVLDNLEHLLPAGASFVGDLVDQVEHLTILATSRQRLGLAGEQDFPVGPLATPSGAEPLESLSRVASVKLFADRARAVEPDFQVTAENAPRVAELCRRLEGIPLALELAAARASVLSPREMLVHLERRFEFLVNRKQDADSRHRSLQAAIDGNYELLSPDLQRFFARLSVFRGGWSLEAAADVCHEIQALDSLEALRACSLVLAPEQRGVTRYRLLETLREYGASRLQEFGEVEAIRERHLAFFLRLAEEARPQIVGTERETGLARLRSEQENLRAVLDWAAEQESGATALDGTRLATALERFWELRGIALEGLDRLERLLTIVGEARDAERARARVSALHSAARLAHTRGLLAKSRAYCEEALALCRAFGSEADLGTAMCRLGLSLHALDQWEEARRLLEEATSLQRRSGDRAGLANTLFLLAMRCASGGDPGRSRELFEECVAIRREIGDRAGMASPLRHLGNLRRSDDPDAAARYYTASLDICREIGHKDGVAYSLLQLGRLARDRDDLETAAAYFEEMRTIWCEIGDRNRVAAAQRELGLLAQKRGDLDQARRCFQESLTLARETGDHAREAGCLYALSRWAEREAEAADLRAQAVAAYLRVRELITPRLESLAAVRLAAGEVEQAALLLGTAAGVRSALAAAEGTSRLFGTLETEEALRLGREEARRMLDASPALGRAGDPEIIERFAAAWARGRLMTLEEAVLGLLRGE